MKVSELPDDELTRRLRESGLHLRIGPFVARVSSCMPDVGAGIRALYAAYEVPAPTEFADFVVSVDRPRSLRRWLFPQVSFYFDGATPFRPLPADQAFAMFEWGLNWCISGTALRYLIVHAAVIERDGLATLLPGAPGAGKSTLCAGLVSRGWRLLSDEMALIDPESMQVLPVPRPVSLKNDSIEVIRAFAPGATFGPLARDTAKGTVAHMKAPDASVDGMFDPARIRWVIYPRYAAGVPLTLTERSRAGSMLHLARNAMTYDALGPLGFETLCAVVDGADCHDLTYSRLDDAVDCFSTLAREAATA